ncbi:hypothetical protein Taro_011947 [Colocasia esculenta]|uniref:Uncharacterized protein n=1 Tax=Colocasia esculenta TaxID=4460 RepID=A0A843UCA3_COLES|nr:hypothetical protein [Colocasia esculenta]
MKKEGGRQRQWQRDATPLLLSVVEAGEGVGRKVVAASYSPPFCNTSREEGGSNVLDKKSVQDMDCSELFIVTHIRKDGTLVIPAPQILFIAQERDLLPTIIRPADFDLLTNYRPQLTTGETGIPEIEEEIARSDSEQWRAMVGVVLRLGRMSSDVRRGVSSRTQHPQAQAPALVPQKHGHGGPSIMERFRRMAPPSIKGESQPLLSESWMIEVEMIFRAIRCAEEDKVSLATYMLQVLRVLCGLGSRFECRFPGCASVCVLHGVCRDVAFNCDGYTHHDVTTCRNFDCVLELADPRPSSVGNIAWSWGRIMWRFSGDSEVSACGLAGSRREEVLQSVGNARAVPFYAFLMFFVW